MIVSLILAHPDKDSLNHAIAAASLKILKENGHKVHFHDLYRDKFNPIFSSKELSPKASVDRGVARHCEEIISSDGIIIVHPNWWGQPPAILKGWIDRVFRPGVAYKLEDGDKGEGIPTGLLEGKTAVIFNTSNTTPKREKEMFGDPLQALWKRCIFGLCGVERFYRKNFSVVDASTPEERASWLADVVKVVDFYFPQLKKET